MNLNDYLQGKKVVVRGYYSGCYFGTVSNISDDGDVIHLTDACQIRKVVTDNTSGGLAGLFHGNPVQPPDIEEIKYRGGEIILLKSFEIFPLDEKAIEFIERYKK